MAVGAVWTYHSSPPLRSDAAGAPLPELCIGVAPGSRGAGIGGLLLDALFAVQSGWASPELAQQKTCMACHAVDRKLVGPAYKDVAAKYAGQRDAAAHLADKIVKGGVGVWGPVPMPANPKVSATEARQLANWILSIK